MVKLEDLNPGMRVKIVANHSKSGRWNFSGKMDKYCGTIMTVRRLDSDCARMYEDQGVDGRDGGWCWYPEMIDYVINEDEDIKSPGAKELKAVLFL